MIFYFTGTGNSLFAAKRLLSTDEQLISIADAIKEREFEYAVKHGENVGLVFPVYFYTLPKIICDFISKLKLDGAEYIYAVITCGGGISQSGAVLKKNMLKNGLKLDYVTPLLMPDNSMLFYQIPPIDEAKKRLPDAEKRLVQIKSDITNRVSSSVGNISIASDLVGLGYKLCNKTAKFYADENCIGCGLCSKNCPEAVIEMKAGKPCWVKPSCQKCSACINRCPKQAIQYGKSTKNRNRYVNPELTVRS